ncbi:hypothetical protein [Leptospira sp. GIMC2001]|uniref:hypothetical protein n=1 Tax=Leptospira sp. GIMC2001 TaxID=1513297 RepID=UPI00234B788C|nr:hypothetical protein [Leptospira sp. GIMC2001]WCL47578.1 hypothetical protein O4O04_01015 [Leptospira sp. GIMC2001]
MIKIQLAIIGLSLFALFCAAPEVSKPQNGDSIPSAGNLETPALLRLTYDLAFRPPANYVMEEVGNLHEKGNRYKIRFGMPGINLTRLTISSTNTENRSKFPYEVSDREIEKAKWKKYYYLKVKDQPNSATVSLFSCTGDLVCVRWEWFYNGFLVVFESETELKKGVVEQDGLAEAYHDLIEKHLLVY